MYLRRRYYTRRLKLRAKSVNSKPEGMRRTRKYPALVGLPSTRTNPSLFAGRIRESCEILTRGLLAKFIQQIFDATRHYLNSSCTCRGRVCGCYDIKIELLPGILCTKFREAGSLSPSLPWNRWLFWHYPSLAAKEWKTLRSIFQKRLRIDSFFILFEKKLSYAR